MVQWSQKAACGSRRDRLLPEEGKAMILRGKKLTVVSTLHYIRILYRSILFILLLIGYVSYRLNMGDPITETLEKRPLIIVVTCPCGRPGAGAGRAAGRRAVRPAPRACARYLRTGVARRNASANPPSVP